MSYSIFHYPSFQFDVTVSSDFYLKFLVETNRSYNSHRLLLGAKICDAIKQEVNLFWIAATARKNKTFLLYNFLHSA